MDKKLKIIFLIMITTTVIVTPLIMWLYYLILQ